MILSRMAWTKGKLDLSPNVIGLYTKFLAPLSPFVKASLACFYKRGERLGVRGNLGSCKVWSLQQ